MNQVYKELKENWISFKRDNPKVRIRDAAKLIGTSEAALLSTEINNDVNYLKVSDIKKFILEILKVDKIMILTRNDSVVHELTIKTEDIIFNNNQIIDKQQLPLLTLNYDLFKYFFYQKKMHAGKELQSFQIFDKNGNSCVKFFYRGNKSLEFERLAESYSAIYDYALQKRIDQVKPLSIPTNTYFGKNYKKNFNIANLKHNSIRDILDRVKKNATFIEVQVCGIGSLQYFRGKIDKVVKFGTWENILDENFNLHVHTEKFKKIKAKWLNTSDNICCAIDFICNKENILARISFEEKGSQNFKNFINEIKEHDYV